MFIGHYAPAFIAAAAGRQAPSLGAMFVAAQLIDLGFFSLSLIDVERFRLLPATTPQLALDLYHMPFTHSLLGTLAIAALWAVGARLRGHGWRIGLIGAAVVTSHWLLDLLVHQPDLTLAGDPPKLGLGLWAYPVIERPLELLLAFGAMAWFVRRTRPIPPTRRAPVIALATALLVVQAIDWFSPPPAGTIDPVPASVPLTALAAYAVLALLAWWLGRSRSRAGPAVTTL